MAGAFVHLTTAPPGWRKQHFEATSVSADVPFETQAPESNPGEDFPSLSAVCCEANTNFGLGYFDRAAELYSDALQTAPLDAGLYADRAACWIMLGYLKKALDDCNRALRIDKTLFRAHERKIKTLLRLGRFKHCCQSVDEGMRFASTPADKGRLANYKRMAQCQTKFSRNDYWELTSYCSQHRLQRKASDLASPAHLGPAAQKLIRPRVALTSKALQEISDHQLKTVPLIERASELESMGKTQDAMTYYEMAADLGSTSSMDILARCHWSEDVLRGSHRALAQDWAQRCYDHGPDVPHSVAGVPDVSMALYGKSATIVASVSRTKLELADDVAPSVLRTPFVDWCGRASSPAPPARLSLSEVTLSGVRPRSAPGNNRDVESSMPKAVPNRRMLKNLGGGGCAF